MKLLETDPVAEDLKEDPASLFTHLRGIVTALTGEKAAYVVIIVAALVFIYLFTARGMRFFLVPSASMEPTLYAGDYLLTLKPKAYHRGDVVVIRDRMTDEYLVKRIAGRGGDRLKIENGALYINGLYASEPYMAEPMTFTTPEPVTVPEEEVFLLGDNRNHSEDSASRLDKHPTYPESDIVGEVRFVYYPVARWNSVLSFPLINLAGR